jgi:hypothetical protein
MAKHPRPHRIGTRWARLTAPFAHLVEARPVPTSATDTVLSGTTEAGTAYELRYARRRSRVRARCTIALVLGRDAESRVSGPPLARAELAVMTQVHCDEPRDTVFFGQLPGPGARFEAFLGDEQPLSANVSAPVENGCRVFVLGLPGTAQRVSARVLDESGTEHARVGWSGLLIRRSASRPQPLAQPGDPGANVGVRKPSHPAR